MNPITTIAILFLLISLFIIYHAVKRYQTKARLGHYNLKNPFPSYPLIGSLPTIKQYDSDPMGFLHMIRDGFEAVDSDIFYFEIGAHAVVTVKDPEIVHTVAKSPTRSENFLDLITMTFGVSGTFNLNGDEWLFHRKHSTPILKKTSLKSVSWVFEECCEKLMRVVDGEKGEPIELSQLMNEFTFDVIGLVAFGVDFHSLDHEQSDVLEAFKTMLDLFSHVCVNPVQSLLWKIRKPFALVNAQKILHGRAESVIKDKISRLERGEVSTKEDLTDMLLSKYDLSDTRGLIGEIFTFLLAGSETSSSTLTYLLYTLSRHPEIQQRAHEEVIEKVGNRPITFEDVSSLQYIKCCLDEAARLYTVAPAIDRRVDRDIIKDGKVVIPSGEIVVYPTYLVHTDPKIWKNPEEYNPDRFLNLTELQKMSFNPFGGGKRICIGKTLAEIEIVWLAATVLQNYTLTPASDVWPIPMKYTLTTKSNEDLCIQFNRRNEI